MNKKNDLQLNMDSIIEAEKHIIDPNAIIVNIANPTPIVILFGPVCSGKTMALIRLTRYLRENGYIVEPDRIFRSTLDTRYTNLCDTFSQMVDSDEVAPARGNIDFMLISVMNKYGKPVCQILIAPGEHFFDTNPKQDFPAYLGTINRTSNRKVWIFFTEINWKNQQIRNQYANKVAQMRDTMDSKDKVILICSKADIQVQYYENGMPVKKNFLRSIGTQYPKILNQYKNNSIKGLFSKYCFNFVVFSAGIFVTNKNGNLSYNTPSSDYYPKDLWKAILKSIK